MRVRTYRKQQKRKRVVQTRLLHYWWIIEDPAIIGSGTTCIRCGEVRTLDNILSICPGERLES
jgi:hypothetical protein